MTAVMRAMPLASGPRVIRVGVVQRGRVVEERVIKQRITVTVGSSEEATFLIPSPVVPPVHALFERDRDGYALNVLAGMSGRIALASGILDLPDGPARIALTDDARGKVVIGHTTLLFQFVDPPPVQPRPQLPLAVKGGLGSNDWSLTFIAAFSFLVHFGLVGAMYSDWSDPIVADRYDVAGLTDLLSRIPTPPVEVPDQPGSITPTTPTRTETAPTKTETAQTPSSPRQRPTATQSPSPSQVDTEKAARLAERAESMRIENLVALQGGPAVGEALKRSNVPGVDLSSAAERNIGVAKGGSELNVGNGGEPVQASKRGGLSVLGGPTKTEGIGDKSGTQTATAGPTAIAQVGTTNATVAIPNADSVVAGLRGRFRSCYQKGLLEDSTMSGKVTISAKVGVNGEVVSSDVVSSSGLSPAVGRCIADVVRRATFSAPGGGGSTLQIPVTFVQSK
jgi:TonB family protein